MIHYNVAIIGGGMVGAALAVSLRKTHLKIALIDALPLQGEDARLIALNANSVNFFEKLGIWPELKLHAAPMEQIHVSHQGHFGITRIDSKELNIAALGYVVPAKHINTALNSALTNNDASNITLIRPAKLNALTQTIDAASLTVTHSSGVQTFDADIVIGADGSYSTVRDLLGIAVDTVDYQQSALVTKTYLQRPHKNIAYERFQAEGAIAMLPLPDKQVATIWTASDEKIKQLLQLTDQDFLTELQTNFGYRLGRMLSTEKRAIYPLKMLRAKEQLKQNVLLIGNAAHTFHPIASQGLNLALYEVAYLAEYLQVLRDKITLHDISLPSTQEKFSKNLSHHLTWIFSSDYFVFNLARQVGMLGLDLLPSVKKQFALRAMGQYPK